MNACELCHHDDICFRALKLTTPTCGRVHPLPCTVELPSEETCLVPVTRLDFFITSCALLEPELTKKTFDAKNMRCAADARSVVTYEVYCSRSHSDGGPRGSTSRVWLKARARHWRRQARGGGSQRAASDEGSELPLSPPSLACNQVAVLAESEWSRLLHSRFVLPTGHKRTAAQRSRQSWQNNGGPRISGVRTGENDWR